ncbi:hypothetical protein CRU99_02305 [Malaciobacter mytili]|uniref:putative quinol monooxygenase n=1 Tax=Malaciobacter mytili TaxID=603050 RepID=UPI00100AB24A|nr:antibiotic biosynthesis monooxygenase family protein [Malaciobacter mytili]RXI47482.1 hypothetical protein CRU99_02305 [Malaciobacter mytili]
MSIVKQTVYIANQSKQNDLKKLLFTHLLNIKKFNGCLNYEVYEADDDELEFLVYEEWASEEAIANYKQSQEYEKFMALKKVLVRREEILPSF